jgi:hypothetical protein
VITKRAASAAAREISGNSNFRRLGYERECQCPDCGSTVLVRLEDGYKKYSLEYVGSDKPTIEKASAP